jgi:hypothetical protein
VGLSYRWQQRHVERAVHYRHFGRNGSITVV